MKVFGCQKNPISCQSRFLFLDQRDYSVIQKVSSYHNHPSFCLNFSFKMCQKETITFLSKDLKAFLYYEREEYRKYLIQEKIKVITTN